jgi:hypothetical protein
MDIRFDSGARRETEPANPPVSACRTRIAIEGRSRRAALANSATLGRRGGILSTNVFNGY